MGKVDRVREEEPNTDINTPSVDTYCCFADFLLYTCKQSTVEQILKRINTVARERIGRKLMGGKGKLLVQRTFAAAAKRMGHNPARRGRLPLTVDVLVKIKPFFDFTLHEDRALWAILCVGVFALARIGELTPGKRSKLKVTVGSVSFKGTQGKILLVGTKTDRRREGITLNFFKNDSVCCPITAMRAYLTGLRHSNKDDPLFADTRGIAFSQTWVVTRMRKVLTLAGLEGEDYSGISLRRGGAQTLLRLHASDKVIMGMGRWRSTCFRRYLKVDEQEVAATDGSVRLRLQLIYIIININVIKVSKVVMNYNLYYYSHLHYIYINNNNLLV